MVKGFNIPLANLAEQKRRLQICKDCEKYFKGLCKECGCIILLKVKLQENSCPLNKHNIGE